MCVCVCVRAFVCACVSMFVWVYGCVRMDVCVCVGGCMYANSQPDRRADTHIDKYTIAFSIRRIIRLSFTFFSFSFFLPFPASFYQRGKYYLIGASRPPEMWNTPFPSTGPDYVWLDGQPLSMAATGP